MSAAAGDPRFTKIRVGRDGAAATVTLAVPERRNAIGPAMVNELLHALEEAHADAGVRAIVLTGEGKAFCAGGDFAQMPVDGAGGADGAPALAPKGDYADLLAALVRAEKPVIAKVNGAAMGGGLGLVAASTFAVASDAAAFGTPEIQVGLFPMMIMAVLARLVPKRKLLEMMTFGEKLAPADALAAGLVNRVVPAASLDAEVSALVERVAKTSPLTLKLGLRAYADQADLDLEAALPLLRGRLGEVLATDDAREGLMAFLEKRAPHFTGT